ncbi:MAG TPA: NAD-dependent epimerase/dehydratase family protein [Longimicrobiales bacterium]|nr:NAD-dependent epimerase/dehydratase family protein [Longimicrobiales bacterium]
MPRYLVTGAAGFIGSKVSELLLERGDEVVGVDNLNDAYDVRLKEWRLDRLLPVPGFRFEKRDIADRSATAALFDGAKYDGVINLAARAGVRQSVANPWVYNQTNSDATLNLLHECVTHDVGKFVLASTSSLYGGDHPQPYAETLSTERPLSPYASSKKAAEVMCYTYHYLYGIDVTILRYFTVYGPAGRPDMSLFRFVQWISEGRPVTVYGDGRQSRDFTFVDDVARGTIAGLTPVGYEIINLGSDEPVVLADAITLVEQLTGQQAQLHYVPRHPADVLATWADIGKAERLLGWRPGYDFRKGVGALVDWYGRNREWARDIRTD